MKRIGYIYKYNENEKEGILVYGQWKNRIYMNYRNFIYIQDKPVRFSYDDCKTIVKTGNLVYFDESEGVITNIERASLANFDTDIINKIIASDRYYDNTHIIFEYLEDIDISSVDGTKPKEDRTDKEDDYSDKNDDEDFLGDLYDDDEYDVSDISYYNYNQRSFDSIEATNLPGNIDELFDCFGKYNHRHYYKDDCASIDILDFSLWVDEEIMKDSIYGSSVEEVAYLCDIFVYRKRIDDEGNTIVPKRENDCISDAWKFILSKFHQQEICHILKNNPILQPAIPSQFCFENLDFLSEEYGMPNLNICKKYNEFQIAKANNASDYYHLFERFHSYANCSGEHLDGEGVPMCKMGKKFINKLMSLLEQRYNEVISFNIKEKFVRITGISIDTLAPTEKTQVKNAILSIGVFIEVYEDMENNYHSIDETFKNLPETYQKALYLPTRLHINNTLIEHSKKEQTTPSELKLWFCLLKDWINASTKEEIISIVNLRFSKMENLSELGDAYDSDFITAKQYFDSYKKKTKDYSIYQLMNEIADRSGFEKPLPLTIQWYIVSRIIDLFNFHSLTSYEYVRLDSGRSISNMISLLEWIDYQKGLHMINKLIVSKAENKLLAVLTEKEKWYLFKEGLVSTPGINNIRKELNQAYRYGTLNSKLFNNDCFQDIMYEDFLASHDNNLKFLIAEYLTPRRQKELERKSKGVIKLYLWLKSPDENYNWNLITSYYAELPEEQQIKLFRFIFYLIANKRIILCIDELFNLLVNSGRRVSPAISGFLFLLKERLSPSYRSMDDVLFANVIEDGLQNLQNFLMAKTFFYPCYGHVALTHMKQDSEHQIYNGSIYKTHIKGKEYFSISFYDVPHDICNQEVDWLNDEDIKKAKIILETNVGFTEIIDGNYIIDISKEVAVKQYVMDFDIDDCCCLLDLKQEMLDKGYLPPQNSYQPLYTNYRRPYEKESYEVCRCTNYIDVDPSCGLPFYWCNKKPCARRCHYIHPTSDWEEYKLPDFIYILLGCENSNLSDVWRITSDISLFFNSFIESSRLKFCNDSTEQFENYRIISQNKLVKETDEIGSFTKDFSVVKDIHDNDEEEQDDYDDSFFEEASQQLPTYGRYRGSYAQDEMGYSDDDIDTIFDGDPSAYWNID